MDKRFEITYYIKDEDEPNGLRKGHYHTDDITDAQTQARILRNELGYFPVVVYDTLSQDWVDF